jgi:hypothetical protein
MSKVDLSKKTLLELLKEFSKTSNYLDDVNLNMIEFISYANVYGPTVYDNLDPIYNTYTKKITEYSEDKLSFEIYIQKCSEPIKIMVINSKETIKKFIQSYKSICSYEQIEQIEQLMENPIMDKFVKFLSKNKLMYLLEMIGFVLGYLTNSNIGLL